MPATPANSTNGKYFGSRSGRSPCWPRTASSLVSWNRAVNDALPAERLHDAHAFEALLQRREVVAMRSRTSRYARFDSRRNQRLAKSDRRHDDEHAERELPAQHEDHDDRAARTATMFCTNIDVSPDCDELLQRVDVGGHARRRAGRSSPARRSRGQRHQVAEHAHAQVAEERSRRSARRAGSRAGRGTTPTIATTRYSTAARFSARRVAGHRCPGRCRSARASGPASSRRPARAARTATTIRPRYGRSMRRAAQDPFASARDSVSSDRRRPAAPSAAPQPHRQSSRRRAVGRVSASARASTSR